MSWLIVLMVFVDIAVIKVFDDSTYHQATWQIALAVIVITGLTFMMGRDILDDGESEVRKFITQQDVNKSWELFNKGHSLQEISYRLQLDQEALYGAMQRMKSKCACCGQYTSQGLCDGCKLMGCGNHL